MCNKKILLADDNENILDVCKKILTPHDFDMKTFTDGTYLLKYFKSEYKKGKKIPLCILDMRMPLLDGLKTAQELRTIDQDVIIIIITAYSDVSLNKIKKNLKRDIYYISKPFNVEEFYCLTDSLLKSWNQKFRLKDSEEKYRQLVSTMTDPVMVFDGETKKIIEINEACEKLYGYKREEFLSLTYKDITSEPEKSEEAILKTFMGDLKKIPLRYHRKKDETVFPVEISTSSFMQKGKKVLCGVIRDITERLKKEKELKHYRENLEELVKKRTTELTESNEHLQKEIQERKETEKALRKSEQSFRSISEEYHTLLETIPDMVILVSPDMKIQWINSMVEKRTGMGKILNKNCYEIIPGSSLPIKNCPASRCFVSGKQEREQLMTSDNSYFDVIATPIKGEKEKIIKALIVARDITEKIFLQKETFKTSHLASIGKLAAGMAHEINNPVTGIINYAQILANITGKGTKEYDVSCRIIKEGERIASVIKSLLSFACSEKETKVPMNINEIIFDSLSPICEQIKREGINININIPDNLTEIKGHPGQIKHVFLNILLNSRHALNKKYGEAHQEKNIEISAEKITIEKREYIRIIFYDNGYGIPEEIMDRIMDPFFSTEPLGEATGMGLSISYGIIKALDGNITINSVEDKFTKVIIDIPVWRQI